MSGLKYGRRRHRSVDNDNGSDVLDAIADAASCMAGLASAAGSAMACRYESQFESRAQRANRRARKIRRRLGGSDCLMEEFPPRPCGMHWATYRRLEAQEVAADERWEAVVMTLVGRSRGGSQSWRRKP